MNDGARALLAVLEPFGADPGEVALVAVVSSIRPPL